MFQDVLFSLHVPRIGERLHCLSRITGHRTKTNFVLSCQIAPRLPGNACYLIQTLDGLHYAVLVGRVQPIPQVQKEADMSPSKAKAVAATTAFVMPTFGQNLMYIHRTTTFAPAQVTTNPIRGSFPGCFPTAQPEFFHPHPAF